MPADSVDVDVVRVDFEIDPALVLVRCVSSWITKDTDQLNINA